MYSGWISEREDIEDDCGVSSVLNSFPAPVGKEVTISVIRNLVQLASDKREFFKTEKDLEWTMEVICFGLTMPLPEVMPLPEAEMIKNCVYLYLDWTSVMSVIPKPGIPIQIEARKEHYFCQMLQHFTNLFIPRESTSIIIQAKLCSQVLQHIRGIVQEKQLDKDTSDSVLRFYLGIAGHLLSVPPMPGGLAEHLAEHLINTLITVWLTTCCLYFPSPTLWCTLRDMFMSWRHHHTVVVQWNKLMYMLTHKVLRIMFGPDYQLPSINLDDDSGPPIIIPDGLTKELTMQVWFRFLHIIGNPVQLSKPDEISKTEFFMQYALEQERPPESHPSLRSLPITFTKAMKGVSMLVSMFLGDQIGAKSNKRLSQAFQTFQSNSTGHTPPLHDRNKDFDKISKSNARKSIDEVKTTPPRYSQDDSDLRTPSASNTPENVPSAEINCILHLFGSWIFETCLSGGDLEQIMKSLGMISCGLKPQSLTISKEDKEKFGNFPPVRKDEFEPGRAQAFSILCKIFCNRQNGQPILPVYLSRFYLSLAVGLCYGETRSGQVLGSILLSAEDLFRIDLQGVNVLVPHVLQALEIILPCQDREINLGHDFDLVELRRACIQLLLSLICLPNHFMPLAIQGLCRDKILGGSDNGHIAPLTFISLKSRITNVLLQALEVETNPANTQMLLGGAMLLMEDTVAVESYSGPKVGSTVSLPTITIEETNSDSTRGSPKLLHIARGVDPTGNETLSDSSDASKKSTKHSEKTKKKDNIGIMGDKKDLLTTKGLYVNMVGLLKQKLLFAGKWRGDLNVTLAGLEFLSGMAQLDAKFIDEDEAKKAVMWICDYIEYQSKRPPQYHSRDLHSIIVSAFTCVGTWIVSHPWLLDSEECLSAVLEVIELGISGSKSKPQTSEETPELKGDKDLKPISFRVREAAEALLAVMMEHLDGFPASCGPASVSSLLEEEYLLKSSKLEGKRKFVYYAVDGSIIIAVLEDAIDGVKEELPSIQTIVRGPTGKNVSFMQFRHFCRTKQHTAELYKLEPSRPPGLAKVPVPQKVTQRYYPVEVERVEKTNSDFSIPEIDSILEEDMVDAHNHMSNIMNIQGAHEAKAVTNRLLAKSSTDEDEYKQKQPRPIIDYHASRLFLSHMGMLNLQGLKTSKASQTPSLQLLTAEDGYSITRSLAGLDRLSNRTYDTILVCFVRKGQSSAQQIADNKISGQDSQSFMEFLQSLGWPVNLNTHYGWTGDPSTSWLIKKEGLSSEELNQKLYYFADLSTEVAILVPSLNLEYKEQTLGQLTKKLSSSMAESIDTSIVGSKEEGNKQSSDTDSEGKTKKLHGSSEFKSRLHSSQSETKVIVAWLQDFGDSDNFPAVDLVQLFDPQEHAYAMSTSNISSRVPDKEIAVIFVNPLKTGLYRIKVVTQFGSSIGGPLIDGMVVSRRALGTMVRNTAINICRRRRMEIDSFSPPHVCRKLRIQEIIKNYAKDVSIPELYASLFKHDNCK